MIQIGQSNIKKTKGFRQFFNFLVIFFTNNIPFKYNFSNSNITWKENVNISFSDAFLNFDKEKINFNGRTSFDVKNQDEFYKFFQIKKDLRKDIKKIELDFNYDLNEEKITFDNLRIDNKSNKKIEEIISNFNSNSKKFFNKVTFKNFVNDILAAYFG